ncbi:MAG: HipA domain-containing protein [Sulfurimonas sp.]|jgi:serine/threonine-protein kinase HipA|nr:HipA domain-containing protein [Sulfurimonas sp.]
MKKQLNQTQEMILSIVNKYQEIKSSQIIELTNLNERSVQRALKKLSELGYLEALGTTRDRRYRRIYSQDEAPYQYIVFNSGEKAGKLSFGNGEYIFKYDENYKSESFEGLAKGKENKSVELFAFFENLIPEYERREKLLRDKEELGLVLEELSNSHGALDFIPLEQLHKYQSTYGKRDNWISVKNEILGENDFPNLLDFELLVDDDIIDAESNTEHSDLSGFQTKVDVDIDFKNKQIIESKNAEYLLKPRNKHKHNYFHIDDDGVKRYYPYLALNEHLFMSFAKNELGFNVPYTAVVKAKDIDFHYITKRYDRYKGLKYPQKDFAQVLNVLSKDKYKSDSQALFEALDKTLMNKEQKMEALKFYFYSYLIKHADLHLKNIAALNIGNSKYILSPLYDLISIGIYNGDSYDLGLGIRQPFKKPKNWSMDDFYILASLVGISSIAFKKEARKILKIFIEKLPEYIKKVEQFEQTHPLKMQKTRNTHSNMVFSQRVLHMYNEKIIQLKKQGIIQELELIEEAGGVLNAEKKVNSTNE